MEGNVIRFDLSYPTCLLACHDSSCIQYVSRPFYICFRCSSVNIDVCAIAIMIFLF